MPVLGGLLRRQDPPSGFDSSDSGATNPAAALNGRSRLASKFDAGGVSLSGISPSGSPVPQPDAYAAALQPMQPISAGNHTGSTTAATPPGVNGGGGGGWAGGGSDYMAAMGGDWWKAWNAMPAASPGASSPQVHTLCCVELHSDYRCAHNILQVVSDCTAC